MDSLQINKARIVYYGLFSSLFSYVENEDDYKKLVYTIGFLNENPIDEISKEALNNLKNFLEKDNAFTLLKEENNSVFFSPSSSFVPTTASYYLENRDDGQKRIEMTNLVLKSNFRKDTQNFKEAEDHIGFIFSFIEKLIGEDKTVLLNEDIQNVFSNILNNMIDEFIEKIYSHEDSCFYKDIAVLLKVFIELERTLLNIEKSETSKKRAQQEIFHKKKKSFKKKIKRNFDEVTSL